MRRSDIIILKGLTRTDFEMQTRCLIEDDYKLVSITTNSADEILGAFESRLPVDDGDYGKSFCDAMLTSNPDNQNSLQVHRDPDFIYSYYLDYSRSFKAGREPQNRIGLQYTITQEFPDARIERGERGEYWTGVSLVRIKDAVLSSAAARNEIAEANETEDVEKIRKASRLIKS